MLQEKIFKSRFENGIGNFGECMCSSLGQIVQTALALEERTGRTPALVSLSLENKPFFNPFFFSSSSSSFSRSLLSFCVVFLC